jgi:hypothetical protein
MPEDAVALLRTWLKRARESQFAHYAADRRLTLRHYYIGIPAAILSAVVGTSVFASLNESVDTWAKILVGLIAVVAAVLTSLQTFWRFSEQADRHRKAAGTYSGIRREIESQLVFQDRINFEVAEGIRKKIDVLAAEAPSISKKDWDAAVRSADNAYFLGPRSDAAA